MLTRTLQGVQAEPTAIQGASDLSEDVEMLTVALEATPNGDGKADLDGMSALLRAGEIVGRRGRR